jgi:NAD(P)-dependent dehydrogenase (short-subunit alcohol dehydrogenase family)
MDIRDKPVIISGGASGLGAATARLLARAGAKVAILDLQDALAEKLAKEINGTAIDCDVSDEEMAEQAIEKAEAAHGLTRVLVNCAGIGSAGRIVTKEGPMPLREFEKIIRINLIGTFNLIRLVASRMIGGEVLPESERGVIISTASIAAYEGQVGQAAYAASKGGVVSLTLPAAREFAQFGIRVNAIAPGLFATPLLEGLPEEARKSLASAIPYPKRLGHAEEFAKLVLHIVENTYINGEVIRIDGSLRMQPK